ncbi:hypothetical protein TNCV_4915421 [Trichonephila clavipes]|nr:hypothetical protein TNCV_4915421 [Trichonephila clavipes]
MREEIASILSEVFKPSSLPALSRRGTAAVDLFILELPPVCGRRKGLLVVSKVARAMPKDMNSQYFKDASVHRDLVILSTKRSRFTAV